MTKIRKLTQSCLGGSSLTAASSRATTCAIPASLRSLAIAIFLVLAFPLVLHGAFVNGIQVSEGNHGYYYDDYNINAPWTETWNTPPPTPPPATGGYNLYSSDLTPLAASTTSPDGAIYSSGSINEYYDASASSFEFHVHSEGMTGAPQPDGTIDAYNTARASWEIQSLNAYLTLNIVIEGSRETETDLGGSVNVRLTDTTGGPPAGPFVETYLLNFAASLPFNGGAPLSYSYTFGVTPGDVYDLSINGTCQLGNNGSSLEDITVSIPTAPDGGLTLGMLGMAMGGLAFIRRKL